MHTLKTYTSIDHGSMFVRHVLIFPLNQNYTNDMMSLKRVYEEDIEKA